MLWHGKRNSMCPQVHRDGDLSVPGGHRALLLSTPVAEGKLDRALRTAHSELSVVTAAVPSLPANLWLLIRL